MKIALLFVLFNCWLCAQTTVLYNPASPTTGPFPANAVATPDRTQKTGMRIDLPSTFEGCDVSSSPSVCSNTALLNQLDGFSVNPRVMACFSAPIDTTTLPAGIRIVPVNGGPAVPINQIIFDPASNCAFAKPNQVLNQQTPYLLLVTNAIKDTSEVAVVPDAQFISCIQNPADSYCDALEDALQQNHPAPPGTIVSASLFTTMSATTWLEKARQFVAVTELPIVLPAGIKSSFSLASLQTITFVPQSGAPTEDVPLSALSGVQTIAFGMFLSPQFLDPSTSTITFTPTAELIHLPNTYVPVSFHVFLPSQSPRPHDGPGFPVAIYGHGLGDDQFGAPTYIASTLAQQGIATLAFELAGMGDGPKSVVQLTNIDGHVFTVATPGRANLNCIVGGAIGVRDCGLQSAVDLSALVATIRRTNGLGMNLDPSRIYYVGQSFGATFGTLAHAVEPGIQAAMLNGAGGTSVDIARLAITGRPLGVEFLASVNPQLLNVDYDNAPPEPPFDDDFNDNYVFRDEPPVTNTVPGAMADQAAFEAADWLGMLGDPLSFAPHLKTAPLQGVPPKSTLFQFGFGDLEVPNPTESAVIRAANADSSAWFLHFEQAAAIDPSLVPITMDGASGLPILPHRVLANPTIFGYPGEESLAIAEQQQAGDFFLSNGKSNPNANPLLTGEFSGVNLFKSPASLPTQLNYFQFNP